MPQLRGEQHPQHKLSVVAVAEIRSRYMPGHVTMMELANVYGVSKQTISRVVNGISWSHIS